MSSSIAPASPRELSQASQAWHGMYTEWREQLGYRFAALEPGTPLLMPGPQWVFTHWMGDQPELMHAACAYMDAKGEEYLVGIDTVLGEYVIWTAQ